MEFHPYKIDLHIHTALSPCADKEMTPPKIIHAARAKGLKMIAVTDHNTAENTEATVRAAKGSGIFVIPGMEVQSREEVHLICLFPDLERCMSWQAQVYGMLPEQANRPEVFGTQPVMDESGQTLRQLEQMLLTSTGMSVENIVDRVNSLDGICIPAHVDRPSFSLLATLGLVPPGLAIEAVELSRNTCADEAVLLFKHLTGYSYVSSSDAHCLTDVGINPTTIISGGLPDFAELKMALGKLSGRKVLAKMKDLAMHIIDIVQNSIEAGAAEVTLTIEENTARDLFTIEIADNGRGMGEETLSKVIDPFFTTRTTRRIGLGLPLLKAATERCDGGMTIDSIPGQGTSVKASFRSSHIDRAPLGNITDAVVNLIAGNPDLNLWFKHKVNGTLVELNAKQLREQLEDVPLNNPAVINWIKNYLAESYNEIRNNA